MVLENPLFRIDKTGRPRSLEDWIYFFKEVYSTANKGLPWYGYERRFLRHALEITDPRNHTQSRLTKLDRESGWFFAWFCGMLSRLKLESPSKMVLLEFPHACPRCFRHSCDATCGNQKRDRLRANRLGFELTESLLDSGS